MKSWGKLYKKEIYNISFMSLVVLLIITAWQFFLFYKVGKWPLGLPTGLSFIPFLFLPLIILWNGYQSFRQEWKDNTIYFLLSLPKPGWQLTLSKLTAGMTFYTVVTLFCGTLIYTFHRFTIIKAINELPVNGLVNDLIIKGFIIYFISGLGLYILSQFSYLISQFFDRFKGLISIIVFILSTYLIFRLGGLLAPLFKWLPDIPVQGFSQNFGHINPHTIYIGSGPLAGSLVVLVVIFFFGSWVLQKHLEV